LQKPEPAPIIGGSEAKASRRPAMSDDFIDGRPSTVFWIVGGAALIWNLFGVMMYVMTVTATPETYAAQGYTQEQIDFVMSTPAWATSAFAIAVNAGSLAALFLLLRKSWAVPVFVLSLAAVLVLDVYNFAVRDSLGMLGMTALYLQATILLVAILLVIYSRLARRKGWLR
jgi:uncharacterized membrane protein